MGKSLADYLWQGGIRLTCGSPSGKMVCENVSGGIPTSGCWAVLQLQTPKTISCPYEEGLVTPWIALLYWRCCLHTWVAHLTPNGLSFLYRGDLIFMLYIPLTVWICSVYLNNCVIRKSCFLWWKAIVLLHCACATSAVEPWKLHTTSSLLAQKAGDLHKVMA